MNKIYSIIISLFIMSNLLAQTNNDEINSIIDQVKSEFAPDKRTAIFNITSTVADDTFILSGETDMPEAKNLLISKINKLTKALADKISLLPSAKIGDKKFAVVSVSVANLRTKPDHPAELASQVLLGTPLKVLKYDDGFYLVQSPDKYIAWVDAEAITLFNENDFRKFISAKKIIFTPEYGFAKTKAESESGNVSDLVRGDILEFIGEEKEFVKVKFPDGRIAFVKKVDSVLFDDWFNSRNATPESIMDEAFNMMGIPYLWGGTSYKGIDCSGFTKTVFFLNGILLSRDASQQVNLGEEIDTKNGFEKLQPGDLLFFGRKADEMNKEKITHVGIYIGNLEYIHESGRVRINSFDPNSPIFSKHRLNQFVRAKRILTSVGKNGVELVKDNKFYKGEIN
ncbi:MAG: C40 family peptidase [Ignavibacteriales bacterium]